MLAFETVESYKSFSMHSEIVIFKIWVPAAKIQHLIIVILQRGLQRFSP